MLDVLNDLKATTEILLEAIRRNDGEKAYETLSVLLMQGMTMLGQDHPAMQQFFPVWSEIEGCIVGGNLDRARGQTETWNRQLDEVIEIVKNSQQ